MKKIVPIILVLALILGFASNALATEITIVSTDPVTATVKQGEEYEEYHVDSSKLKELIVDDFYVEK